MTLADALQLFCWTKREESGISLEAQCTVEEGVRGTEELSQHHLAISRVQREEG